MEISQHKKAAQADDLFRVLVDTVDEYAIFALDHEGHILTWNLGAQRLKGYRADEIIGSHISRFYSEEDRARAHPAYELKYADQHGKYQEEGWRFRKDGTRFWANVVISALRNPDGSLRGFAKVTRDLSEKKRAADLLRESEERFRLMVEVVEDYAIFMLDPQGCVATWNRGAERNKGYTAAEIMGRHFSAFYSDEENAAGKPAWELEEAIKLGRFEDEGWRIRKDGTKFWANVIITPVLDPAGRLLGFAKVTRNLTERKKAEEVLKNAYADLEVRVAQRTRELSEAKNNAETAVKVRDEFLSMASHELRTPISSLKLRAQARKRKMEKEGFAGFDANELRRFWQDDDRQLTRLASLVDRMLDVSRLSSGKFEISHEELDLGLVVQETVGILGPVLLESGNEIRLDIEPNLVIHGDRLRLEQVVTNLLTNAGKYAPGRPVDIRVKRVGESALVTVRDHGPGIPAADRERVFQAFERLASSPYASGLGIGLFLSQRIAEAHGGKIRVGAASGGGAEFIVSLPA